MPYSATRRLHGAVGRKMSKYMLFKKAKRLYSEINRDMSFLEHRFIRTRLSQA